MVLRGSSIGSYNISNLGIGILIESFHTLGPHGLKNESNSTPLAVGSYIGKVLYEFELCNYL
jgi:hypothetical protein